MPRTKRSDAKKRKGEASSQLLTNPTGPAGNPPETPNAKQAGTPEVPVSDTVGQHESNKLIHAREMRLVVPDRGDKKQFDLFLDNANVPHIKLLSAKGRQIWPIDHDMVYSYVTHFLFQVSGGLLPTPAEVKGFISVLKSYAVLNGQREREVDWKDNVLEQDTLTNAVFTLTSRKAPKPWEATAAQVLAAVDLLAAKEALDKGEDWPKAPNRLSIELERRQEVLKELGVSVTKLARVGTARKWRLMMIDSDGGDEASRGPSPSASPGSSQPNLLKAKEFESDSPQDDELARRLEQIVGQSGTANKLNQDKILNWIPTKWSEFVGNGSAIVELKLVVGNLLAGKGGHHVLLTGPEDSGRDAMIMLAIRRLLCEYQDLDTLDPCGKCNDCKWDYDSNGTFFENFGDEKFVFLGVDCANLTADNLAFETSKVAAFKGIRLVYLQRLDHLGKEATPDVLTSLGDKRYVFFATASGTGSINQEVLRHFEIQMTSDPTIEELALFLAERCRDWGIKVDSGHTLIRLAHISGQRTGDALEVLAEAANSPKRLLDQEIVEASFAD